MQETHNGKPEWIIAVPEVKQSSLVPSEFHQEKNEESLPNSRANSCKCCLFAFPDGCSLQCVRAPNLPNVLLPSSRQKHTRAKGMLLLVSMTGYRSSYFESDWIFHP